MKTNIANYFRNGFSVDKIHMFVIYKIFILHFTKNMTNIA